jgi:hypothetical protein
VSRGPVASLARPAVACALCVVLGSCGPSSAVRDAPVDMATEEPSPDAAPDALQDALQDAAGVPDLAFVTEQMTGTLLITETVFRAGDCEVVEGCVGGIGLRRLLRFDTVTANRGTGDLVIGMTPPPGQDAGVFAWSQCHMHHHVSGYTSYELFDDAGTMISARKQAFCIKDSVPEPNAPPGKYSCADQGMTRGWSDGYSVGVPCQWIDVTGLPSGMYTLRVVVNPTRSLPESSYDNNVFTHAVAL